MPTRAQPAFVMPSSEPLDQCLQRIAQHTAALSKLDVTCVADRKAALREMNRLKGVVHLYHGMLKKRTVTA